MSQSQCQCQAAASAGGWAGQYAEDYHLQELAEEPLLLLGHLLLGQQLLLKQKQLLLIGQGRHGILSFLRHGWVRDWI